MLHGEISDEVAPRWLFQFEHLIAAPPEGWTPPRRLVAQRGVSRLLRSRVDASLPRWRQEIDTWVTQPFTVKRMTDMYWRMQERFDVVTFLDLPPVAAQAIQDYLDDRSIPVGRVLRYSPDTLARNLAFMPDVTGVVHALPQAQAKFGPRGWYIPAGSEGWALQ